MKHTYTLTFRGQHVQTWTSVYDVQAVRLGYRRYAAPGQSQWDIPTGEIAGKPEVLKTMKTVAALKRDTIPSRFNTYPDQTFMIVVRPGVTEIVHTEIVK